MITFKTVKGKHIITCNGVEFDDIKSLSSAWRGAYNLRFLNKNFTLKNKGEIQNENVVRRS